METTNSDILEVIESIITIGAIIIGGIWAYFRFSRTREDHPKVQIDLDLIYIGTEEQRCIIECQAIIENKGLVRHYIKDFTFDLLHFTSGDKYQRGANHNGQVLFQKEPQNRKISWLPKDWNYSFVDPGIKQKYTFLADVPAGSKYLLIHSQFKYEGREGTFHTSQKAFNIEDLRSSGSIK